VDDIAQREGLTPTQRTVMGALLGQESDNGANAVTSIDGARGAGQIMPDTFKRYAKDGEDISNQEHNLAVMARIVKDLGTKSGDNPAKIAVGYFSGDGNINSSEGSPWKRDAKDGNGKLVSSYVADVVKRIGNSVISSAQAAPARQGSTQGLPDLEKAPKWADIAANPEYVALSDADKAQAKQEYFNYWIAPHAGGERDTLRKQFLTNPDVKKTEPGILERAFSNPADDGSHGDISGKSDSSSPLVINVEGTNSSSPAYVPQSNSAPVQSTFGADDFGSIYNVKPDQKENPLWGTGSVMSPNMQGKAQTTPTSPEFTQQVNQAWDAGTPEQRIAMGKRDDAVGQLARARNEQYGLVAQDNKSLDKLDTRTEARGRELVRDGLDTSTVAGASEAQYNAMRGTLPGEELGQASKSDFDFETQKTFNESRFYSNPAVRGAVKGYEGYKQGILGINQFVADKIGADDYSKGFARRGAESRSFTGAMGDPKNYAQSSFENIISSIGQQLPAMIGGAMTGSETAVLASMFAQSFGQEYGEGRASGQNQDQATLRAAQYAALEVIGEKFGLKQNMKGWKEITHGNFDKAAKAIASAVKYEVPGEMLTTAGQFLTDKEGYGIGLHTEAGVKEFVQQMVDTVVQTVGQTMLMSGGSKAIGMAADKLGRNQNAAVASATESAPAIPPAAPAQEAAPEHPTVQAADQIVRELAEAAGMSTELLLPKKPEAPAAVQVLQPAVGNADISATPSNSGELETAPVPAQSAVQPAQAQEQFTDQDIVHFAAAREDELLAKRDGGPQVVMSEDGPVEQDIPGAGLSPVEAQELTALEHAADNSAVLRQLYGFDQQLTSEDAAYVPERAQVSEEAATPQTAQGPEAVAPAVNNEIDQAAHEAATSPLNDKPQPTEAQKEAGNYKKGHVILQGLDITIENPEGSTRSGVSEDGKAWESTMQHHYGYIKGTVGADKDHIDTFIGPNHASDRVFVVDQINPKTGKFDEHKVMLGFDSQQEADQAYHDNYDAGWNGRGAITAVSMTNFKEWLDSGNTKKPFVEMAPTIQEVPAVENQPERTKPKTEKEMRQAKTDSTAEKQGLTEKEARARKGSGAQAARDRLERENPFMAFLAKNGVNTKDRGDVGAENNARIMVPGYGPIFKRNAPEFDELAMLAKEDGFLTQADIDDQTDNGGTNKLMDMIRRAINNNEIIGQPRAGETNRFASMARAREEAELLAEANNLGIDTDGMTIEQVYDTVQSRHAEQISEPIDVFEKASSIADAIDDLDADIPFELSDPRLKSTNHFSDEEIDALFGIQKETGNKEAGRAREGARSEDARPGIEGTRAPERGRAGASSERGSSKSFVLEGQTLAEAKAEQEAAESAAKQKAADDRAADEADKKAQFNKEVSARQQASAENFQLGQDANDAIAGQQGIFDAPASENKPQDKSTATDDAGE